MSAGKTLTTYALIAVVACAVVSAQQPGASAKPDTLTAARTLFDRYVALERAFDPAMADLYSGEAIVRNKRTYPTGQVREITIPAARYKELIRQGMPLARQRGDTNSYADCKYSAVGERVRIGCQRYSQLKKYSSPMSLLVGPGTKGEWLVFEEISDSQP